MKVFAEFVIWTCRAGGVGFTPMKKKMKPRGRKSVF